MHEGTANTLLLELGCEELPPLALDSLCEALFSAVCTGLEDAGVAFDQAQSRWLQSPRRMSLLLKSVDGKQADRVLERKGPAVSAAFDENGEPTAAAKGFARSVGREVETLERLKTDKGEWLYCRVETPGKTLDELIYPVVQSALDALPVPKPMRWSDHDFSFVRPVHWLILMHGDRVIPGSLYACEAGNRTRGHRIHAPGDHEISEADAYLETLKALFVLVDPHERSKRIREQATATGEAAGGTTRMTDALLAEVNNLLEWPCAVQCSFNTSFLEVPAEALIASMEQHQKFFPILNREGGLSADFVVMANIDSSDEQTMRQGFERVITPRLADAQFFWQQDLKQPLAEWLAALDNIVFQKDLGSVGDKTRRIAGLSRDIADLLGADTETAETAGRHAKVDLVSLMVGEFPELQGTMGRYYLQHAGASEAVAGAVGEHYLPRFSGDRLPATQSGRIVALADRLDTLIGVFAVGLKPTGNKDPFALRRAALGIIRLLEESDMGIALDELLKLGQASFGEAPTVSGECVDAVRAFLLERLRNHLLEGGASARQVNAVLAAPLGELGDLKNRLEAVRDFMQRPEAESLVAANKRIGNILKKQTEDISPTIEPKLFSFDEERGLYALVAETGERLKPLYSEGRYQAALDLLAQLRDAIDAYFDNVMVMDEDEAVRGNRLAQLAAVKQLFDRVADFSQAD